MFGGFVDSEAVTQITLRGDQGNRTPNPRLAKAVLYQLS